MNVLHVSHLCHLDRAFGTERYQHDLIAASRQHGVRATLLWVAPQAIASAPAAAVRVLPMSTESLAQLRREVEALLAADPPALIHFHTIGGAELTVAALARQRGIPYAFSYHVPTALCATGSLLRWGAVECDGALRAGRCGACAAFGQLRALPRALRWRRMVQWSTTPATIAVGPPLGRRREAHARLEFLAACDRVLVHGERAGAVMLANGVSPAALHVCPPGVSPAFAAAAARRGGAAADAEFVVGYVGRFDRLKGVGILVDAFMRTRWPAARLRIVGVTDAERDGAGHAWRVMARARRDARVSFASMQPLAAGAALYAGLGAVAIPSVGIETGPLVLREALALGLPVLASNRVGEPALARAHARLVEPNTVAAWTRALNEVFEQAQRRQLAPPHDPPRRSMHEVAGDVVSIYRAMLERRASAA